MQHNPFFTIITATYNAAEMLPRFLGSLAKQTCRDFEILVQDGASTDGTVGVVESWRKHLPAISIQSEPDAGIYDAWNKALPRIRGEWALFMGSDDELAGEDTLENCWKALVGLGKHVRYGGGGVDSIGRDGAVVARSFFEPDAVVKERWRHMPFPHQGLWHNRALFETQRFDASLRIVGDYDFLCRTWTAESSHMLPFVVAKMHRGGISGSPQSILRLRWENAVVSSRYFSGVWTPSCLLSLVKGGLVWALCLAFGKSAPAVLDAGRRLRGLPPAWKGL